MTAFSHKLRQGVFAPLFATLYGNSAPEQTERYLDAISRFSSLYPNREEIRVFSAPGRAEIGGNHTDHQHGNVLAAAVTADAIAVVAFHNEGVLRFHSEGYGEYTVSLSDLTPHAGERTPAALVRGIAARMIQLGAQIGGFDMYCTSAVQCGSGVSSSAAFETLVGTVIDVGCNGGRAGALEVAKAGQFAENVYFGKQNGLMDPLTCALGGLVSIDFADTDAPSVSPCSFDFTGSGYCLCLTDTGGNHAGLDAEYHAVRGEMEQVAAYFGKPYLRAVDERDFYRDLAAVRAATSDRAVLRAMHFFDENTRAVAQAQSLRDGDMPRFLQLVAQSGDSSAQLLENLYPGNTPHRREIPLCIALSKRLLGGNGAVRVHGGGFAGTVLAVLPVDRAQNYRDGIEHVFGQNSCRILQVRPLGAVEIKEDII